MITKKNSLTCLLASALLTAILFTPAYAAKKKISTAKSSGGRARISTAYADPYLGAIVVDVATGKVIFEDNADKPGYPASMVKLMDLLIILERIEKGALKLDDKITITAESSVVGGSQAYLKQGEVFSVDDLLYAMIIKSANDVATALAIHIAGTKEGFVQLMNAKAAELGMKATTFGTVHGLPPAVGQQVDTTTPRDMAILACEIVKHAEALRYTSAKQRHLRPGTDKLLDMRTHNHLLGALNGCDGLKTGWTASAGFSITATAIRNNRRVIAVVLGSADRKVRDAKATELITSAFMNLPPLPPPKPAVTNIMQTAGQPADEKTSEAKSTGKSRKMKIALYLGLTVVSIAVIIRLLRLSSIIHH